MVVHDELVCHLLCRRSVVVMDADELARVLIMYMMLDPILSVPTPHLTIDNFDSVAVYCRYSIACIDQLQNVQKLSQLLEKGLWLHLLIHKLP